MSTTKDTLSLSERDKTRAPHGFGYYFEHTNPQRRVPCVVGDMLAPRSADDIAPITPEAMASVQAALTLLAQLVADRDHALYMGSFDKLEEYRAEGHAILRAARGLAGILRVEDPKHVARKLPPAAEAACTNRQHYDMFKGPECDGTWADCTFSARWADGDPHE